MGVMGDIVAFWRAPRATFRARRAEGVREDRAFAALVAASGLAFVAQWPGLARAAHLDPAVPLDARLGGALMGSIFLLPLCAYGVAALSHLAARMLGGRGDGYGARLALFWAFLSASPLMLMGGALAGLAGPGPVTTVAGLLVFAAFAGLWLTLLHESETGAATWT